MSTSLSEPSTPYKDLPQSDVHSDETNTEEKINMTETKEKKYVGLTKDNIAKILKYSIISIIVGVLLFIGFAVILTNILLDVFFVPQTCSTTTNFGSSRNLKVQLENIIIGTSSITQGLNNGTRIGTMRQRKWSGTQTVDFIGNDKSLLFNVNKDFSIQYIWRARNCTSGSQIYKIVYEQYSVPIKFTIYQGESETVIGFLKADAFLSSKYIVYDSTQKYILAQIHSPIIQFITDYNCQITPESIKFGIKDDLYLSIVGVLSAMKYNG